MIEHRYKFNDYLFALSIVLGIMTSLRFSSLPLGISEIFLLIWIFREWLTAIKNRIYILLKSQLDIIKFWIVFLIILSIGLLISAFQGRIIIQYVIHDFSSYLFSFLICLTLSLKHVGRNIVSKIKLIVIFGTAIFSFLMIWWFFIGNDFFGLSLGDYRFTGGAKNPNQLALFISAIPYICGYFIFSSEKKNSNSKKLLYLILLILSIFVGLQIHSDALSGIWVLSIAIFIFILVYKKLKYPINLFTYVIIFSMIMTYVILDNYIIHGLVASFSEWFNELDEDGSRSFLWKSGLQTGLQSPIFGFGPGPQILFQITRAEAHNTFIDILTQTGLVGLVIFMFLLVKLFMNIKINTFLTMALICLIGFGFSHFVFRQPIFWVYLVFFFSFDKNIILGRFDGKS